MGRKPKTPTTTNPLSSSDSNAEPGFSIAAPASPNAPPEVNRDVVTEAVEEHEQKTRKKTVSKAELKAKLDALEEKQAREAKARTFVRGFGRTVLWATEVAIKRMPNPEPLSAMEKEEWQEVCGAMLDKYLHSTEWETEINFAFGLVMIFGLRMLKEKQEEKKLVVVPLEK